MKEKIRRFMIGRYGNDKMNQVLSVIALALILISFIVRVPWLDRIGIVLIIYMYYRAFSKNIPARYAENQKFLKLYYRLTGPFANKKAARDRNKGYKIFKCPQCSQKVRVPKGKGTISIHCPKCNNDFIKRT